MSFSTIEWPLLGKADVDSPVNTDDLRPVNTGDLQDAIGYLTVRNGYGSHLAKGVGANFRFQIAVMTPLVTPEQFQRAFF